MIGYTLDDTDGSMSNIMKEALEVLEEEAQLEAMAVHCEYNRYWGIYIDTMDPEWGGEKNPCDVQKNVNTSENQTTMASISQLWRAVRGNLSYVIQDSIGGLLSDNRPKYLVTSHHNERIILHLARDGEGSGEVHAQHRGRRGNSYVVHRL